MIDYLRQYSPDARRIRGLDFLGGRRLRGIISFLLAFFVGLVACVALFVRLSHVPGLPVPIVSLDAIVLAFISHVPGINIEDQSYYTFLIIPALKWSAISIPRALGYWNSAMFMAIGLYGFIKVLNVYARSHRYSDLAGIERGKESDLPQYMVQRIFTLAHNGDLVGAFFASDTGFLTAVRVGISADKLSEFLRSRVRPEDYRDRIGVTQLKTFSDLAIFIARENNVAHFLEINHVKPDDWTRAARWVSREEQERDAVIRYWGRVALSKTLPLFDELAYGFGTVLKKFSNELSIPAPRLHVQYGSSEVSRMENLLVQDSGANVLLVAPSVELALDVVKDFARDIVYHFPHPSLRDKKCMVVDTQDFAQSFASREDFEANFISLASDAINAGNVILVIDDLAALYVRSEQLGADFDAILRKLLLSSLPCIFLVEEGAHSRVVRTHSGTLDHMHEVKIKEASDDALLEVLEKKSEEIEAEYGLIFTTPAINRIAKDAARTRVQGLLSVRATEILAQVPAWASRQSVSVILPEHVDALVSLATGVPVGKASDDEKDKLLILEDLMRTRVIGQTRAISVLAAALKRSRGGVRDEKKPMASFMFLGPTGVGKTEVSKSLAVSYFDSEEAMMRFDMSEYSSAGSLERLIGTAETPGLLTSTVREHPYGVLLVDEFEKAAREVQDLFLQVLDEGVFHDGRGELVNCRNLIIIATSNAGSREIRLAIEQGKELAGDTEKNIIDSIIAAGIYRPELLNRFDGTILFSPLSNEDYRKVARLMLEKLARRIHDEHGATLILSDALVDKVLEDGINADFGARPLARAIQEKVSDRIADKILREGITPGQEIVL